MVEKVTGSIFTRYEKSARSQQGMAIWRDEASCDVMDLKEKKIVGHFLPESYTGEGSGDPYINHANQALFLSKPERGEQYPPIYITAGNDGGRDEEGYYGRCVVEQIHKDIVLYFGRQLFYPETIPMDQRICMKLPVGDGLLFFQMMKRKCCI